MASLFERLREALKPKYALEREIASGGMGVVFLGENTKLRNLGYRRLSEQCQTILAAIAVMGERSTAEEITAATELPAAVLHRQLDVLEWERWLVSDGRGYSFVARVPRDIVAQDMVTKGQRQRFLRQAN